MTLNLCLVLMSIQSDTIIMLLKLNQNGTWKHYLGLECTNAVGLNLLQILNFDQAMLWSKHHLASTLCWVLAREKKSGNPAFIGLESGAWKARSWSMCTPPARRPWQLHTSRWAIIIVAKNVPWLGQDVNPAENNQPCKTRAANGQHLCFSFVETVRARSYYYSFVAGVLVDDNNLHYWHPLHDHNL